MSDKGTIRPLVWMGSAKRDLLTCADDVQDTFGYALHQAQVGEKHDQAKPLKGFGGAGVLEVVERDEAGAYRAVYTVQLETAVYVLHVFKKKSKQGIATPKADIDMIRDRLKAAREIDKQRLDAGSRRTPSDD